MRKPRVAVQGWRAVASDETARPKKPEHLARAVEHLGPFAFETGAEAIAHGKIFEHSGKRFGISQEMALELVEDKARHFNAEEHLHAGAPRAKDLDEQLTTLELEAAKLARLIQSLNDDTLDELHRAGSVKSEELPALRKTAEAFMLPKPASDAADADGETLVELLLALSEHAGRTRHNWRRRRQREGHAVVDRGGGANLWREHAGGPLWGLVNDTLEIYETFKPGRASGHVEPGPRSQEDGTYRAFVRAVFEYATGNVAAEGGALDRWIKKLAGVRRELGQLERRRDVLDTEWHAVNSSQSPDQDQLAAIEAEEAAVRERIADLRRRMFPHLYRA